jgi:two-component system LytT family response regulator
MNKIKAIIVEDEVLAAQLLAKNIQQHQQIQLEGIYNDGFSGLKAIQEINPDLVFLDIELPKLTGLELLELLDDPPMIIFTTAYNQYAIEAFEKNAIDYLLKPYSKERLFKAIEKATTKSRSHNLKSQANELVNAINTAENKNLDRIALKDNNSIHLIDVNDVIFFEAQDDYVYIHAKQKKYIKKATLKYYEQNLDDQKFVRVHRSFIANIHFIRKMEPYSKDTYLLVFTNDKKINMSRSGLQRLRKVLYI